MTGLGVHLRIIRKERGLVQADLARSVGVSATAIANYEQGTRFPDEDTLNRLADVLQVTVDRLLGRLAVSSSPTEDRALSTEAQTLYDLLWNNRLAEGSAFVTSLRQRGWDLLSIHQSVLGAIQAHVGRRWEQGLIDVYQEHAMTALVRHVMGALSADIPLHEGGPRFLGVVASGDLHELGMLAVIDLLRIDGWNTLYLGVDVPPASLVASIRDFKPQVIGISVTLERNLPSVEAIAGWVRGLPDAPRILAGGRGFDSHRAEPARRAVDAVVGDLRDLTSAARALLVRSIRNSART